MPNGIAVPRIESRTSPAARDAKPRAAHVTACYGRRPEHRNQEIPVTADRSRQPDTRKRKGRQAGPAAPDGKEAPRPDSDRRLVDVDPWAMLLEGLMEEVPGEPDRGERKS